MNLLDPWLRQLGLDHQFWLPATSISIFLVGITLAFVFNKAIYPIVLRFTNFTPTNLDVRLVRAFRRPLTMAILVAGLYFALILPLDLTLTLRHIIDRVAAILGVGVAVLALTAASSNVFHWYSEEISPHTASTLDDRLMPMIRRIVMALIYALGGLLALDLLNVNISPLIAGLGLGGLAVALALQPTLSNLFAGTYVMTEGVVTQGDYIELENGVAGYVIDVGWRSTRLRTWTNNLVVVPNSRFAETIITNYQGPIPAVNIYLTCGVSYDSDLGVVEQVCKEEMDKLLEADPRAVREYGAYFAYESFDDSNITFYLFLQARDRIASFEVQSELIRMVHERFREEGIVINYPMRTINFAEDSGLGAAGQTGVAATGSAARAGYPFRRSAGTGTDAARREAPASRMDTGDGPEGGEGPGPDIG
ncbi:MAG: mechanosensitive ion channel family protein [Chloroflexi bacterium]|nr:mechanosensitive ion channel family protein [Chloroflexota bacterium]